MVGTEGKESVKGTIVQCLCASFARGTGANLLCLDQWPLTFFRLKTHFQNFLQFSSTPLQLNIYNKYSIGNINIEPWGHKGQSSECLASSTLETQVLSYGNVKCTTMHIYSAL